MKILMLKDLKKVGKKGEVVNVSDGYGANYIIPQLCSIYITNHSPRHFPIQQKKVPYEFP